MSSWDSIFADSHFTGSTWCPQIGEQTNANNQINLAPLHFVTDVEPVGHNYHKLVFPEVNTYVVPVLQEDEIDIEELLDTVRDAALDDYYGLLFVKRTSKTLSDDVKKTWKLINLHLHPDKAESSKKASAEARFKACQKAYETLLDPQLKIDYDSSVEFDDAVPAANLVFKNLASFLQVYTPVFERNAYWSKVQPAPALGDHTSSEDDVQKFYKFWLGFQSWRDFPQGDTEKVGDSASRDERRRADAKNNANRARLKKADNERLRAFVVKASELDPRLRFYKAAKAEQDKVVKQAAFDAKQKAGKVSKQELDKLMKEASDAALAEVKERQQVELAKLLAQ